MKTMTATEASRAFAALLDDVAEGEVVVVTRGGRRIATISPASAGNGGEVARLLRNEAVDNGFEDDVRAATSLLTDEAPRWPDD